MMRTSARIRCIMLSLLISGCAALPVDLGVTVSARPQFGISACVLGDSPIVVGQANPDARAYGFARGYVLLGCPTRSAYARSAGVA